MRRPRVQVAVLALLTLLWPLALATPAAASSSATELVHVVLSDSGAELVLTDLASRRSTTLLAAEEALYLSPELSPDGQSIAFVLLEVSGETATFSIATVERDGSSLRRLTTSSSDTTVDTGPRWAPDGESLMVARLTVTADGSSASGDLLRVPRLGGSPSTLVAGAVGGDWAPDGQSVVVLDGPVSESDADAPLSVVELSSGARRPLDVRGFAPAWSPDGAAIGYVSVVSKDLGSSVIATVPAAGGAPTLLSRTAPPGDGLVDAPSWSPDSGSLVYTAAAGGQGGEVGLFAVDRRGTRAGPVLATSASSLSLFGALQGPVPPTVLGRSPAAFTAVEPQRLLDTRQGGPNARVLPGGTVDVQVAGVQTSRGAVPAEATAVVLNVTVTGGTTSTDIRAYPAGAPVPVVSNINASAFRTVPNLVTVPLGQGGAVTLRNNAGSVHLLADLAGWYAPGAGDGFAPVGPGRLLDTRAGSALGAGGTTDLRVTGDLRTADGGTVTVPQDASAVVLNVTGTGGSALSTDVRVYPTPTGGAVPGASNLNLARGQTAAGLVVVAVGDAGRVRLRNDSGQLHLLADVVGYYSPSATGRFVAAEPVRLLDTRNATGAAPTPLLGGTVLDLAVAGARGIPAQATAAVINLTATSVTASTDLRAYPTTSSDAVPTVSTLNVTRGATRANAAIVRTGDEGLVRLRSNSGSVQLIADLAGWFQPAA